MPNLGPYIKIACDTTGCNKVGLATAHLTSEYSGGYCGDDEPVIEIDELPEGWGQYLADDYKTTLFYCPDCCDKFEKEEGFLPWR